MPDTLVVLWVFVGEATGRRESSRTVSLRGVFVCALRSCGVPVGSGAPAIQPNRGWFGLRKNPQSKSPRW